MLPPERLALVLALLGAVAGTLMTNGQAPAVLRIPAAASLALVLPGLGLTAALVGGRVLRRVEWLVFGIALSLCATVVAGFVLDATPRGLQATSWGIALGGVTFVAAVVGAVRMARERRRHARTPSDAPSEREPAAGPVAGVATLAMIAAAALVVVAAVLVARTGVEEQVRPGFTQLWMVPDGEAGFSVGIHNAEGETRAYRLTLTLDRRPLEESSELRLAPDETWQRSVAVRPDGPARLRTLVARLFREGDTEPYRTVSAVIPP